MFYSSQKISTSLLSIGKPSPAVDILIAAICIRRNLVLHTRDEHFAQIRAVRKELKVEAAR